MDLFQYRPHFTGKERDTESGNDYFGARYYASTMGRFLSPDPSGLLAQHPENPQSWNLYVYALNNPLSNLDPNGLDCVYANDAGNGVESIDHDSNSGECGSNGGTWAPGYVDENWAHFNNNTNMQCDGRLHQLPIRRTNGCEWQLLERLRWVWLRVG
jgi:RHS repeat-associated protein